MHHTLSPSYRNILLVFFPFSCLELAFIIPTLFYTLFFMAISTFFLLSHLLCSLRSPSIVIHILIMRFRLIASLLLLLLFRQFPSCHSLLPRNIASATPDHHNPIAQPPVYISISHASDWSREKTNVTLRKVRGLKNRDSVLCPVY